MVNFVSTRGGEIFQWSYSALFRIEVEIILMLKTELIKTLHAYNFDVLIAKLFKNFARLAHAHLLLWNGLGVSCCAVLNVFFLQHH